MSYRYELERHWIGANPKIVTFVMLNPSTADDHVSDPTIRKCVGFAARWGYSGLRVVNLYAMRSTKPAGLWAAADPVGDRNDQVLREAVQTAGQLVVAWGANAKPERVAAFRSLLTDRPLWCLGLMKAGQPRHPLMLPYTTRLERWW